MARRGDTMTPGRSSSSHLLHAGRNLHVFAWTPLHGSGSFGVTVRWRRHSESWRHVRLILFQRNKRPGAYQRTRHSERAGERVLVRRTLTVFEVCTWVTRGGTRSRSGVKVYLRLKAGPGGRSIAEAA